MPFDVEIQTARNGWPGIFIAGDEALSHATDCREIARMLRAGEIPPEIVADWLDRIADKMEACRGLNPGQSAYV